MARFESQNLVISNASGSDMTRPLSRQADLLERLAAALGTTVATFIGADPSADVSVSSHLIAAEEGAALIKAFDEITDPEARQRCLAYVRTAAEAAG